MTQEPGAGDPGANQLLARLPGDVLDSLSTEQVRAIRKAAAERGWGNDHFTNIRLSVPLPFRPVYFSVVAGRERRNAVRRRTLGLQHPLRTFGNAVFAALAVWLLLLAGLVAVLIHSSILEL